MIEVWGNLRQDPADSWDEPEAEQEELSARERELFEQDIEPDWILLQAVIERAYSVLLVRAKQ